MTIFERAWTFLVGIVENFWTQDGPAIQAWLKQFASDEGKLLLSAAASSAAEVLAGKSIQQAGADLVATMSTQGVTVAENDALNAIRTQLNYLQTQPVVAQTPAA